MNPAVQREACINEAEVAADEEEELFVSPPLEPFAGGGGGNIWKQERATDNQSTLSRVLDILKSVAFGSDLTRFQIPVQLNMPKSQLQLYGESVYCVSDNLLDACAKGSTPLERFLRVIAWHISTTRLAPFGQTPFNPILGETHHVSCGNLNVFLEQVSHHPPISALYATNEPANLRLQWWQNPAPRFYGHKVEVVIQGKRELWLDAHKEVYEMTSPNLMIQFFPTFGNEWVGSTTIKCSASDLEATLIFHSRPFYVWWGSIGQITGRVLKSSSQAPLHEISGFYNQILVLKKSTQKAYFILCHDGLHQRRGDWNGECYS
ncbi:hypothetical protein KP509_02G051800 [Ceratopteris richardii]|uniref:Oxysterol-binding protein n=1 Tax=Ceratopteris richardii TaxID=49495 RepID=A0A8T2V5T5_CERRI|nr:hypothetical protein KP509_02G051800 [Ceratopteris richardii]